MDALSVDKPSEIDSENRVLDVAGPTLDQSLGDVILTTVYLGLQTIVFIDESRFNVERWWTLSCLQATSWALR